MVDRAGAPAVEHGGGERLGVDVPEGFAAFYARSYRSVLAGILAVGGSPQEAEDAVQDAMRDVLVGWERIRSPYSYVRTSAVRRLLRARRREREAVARALARFGSVAVAPGPELTLWEDREWVTQFLRELPSAQREVMALLVDEFSPAEVAALLGKTEDAVRQNLHATRRRLGARRGGRRDPSVIDVGRTAPEGGSR